MSRSDRFETFQHENGQWQVFSLDARHEFAAQGATEAEALLALADDLSRELEEIENRAGYPVDFDA